MVFHAAAADEVEAHHEVAPPSALVPKTELLTPNVIGLVHWQRLKNGALLARSTRIDWPTLLRRTFDTDVLECPKCTGHLKVIAIVEPPDTLAILDELDIPRAPPRPARDPTALFAPPNTADLHAE